MLQWTCECKYFFKILISFPLDLYPEMELLDHIIAFLKFFWETLLFCIMYQFTFPIKERFCCLITSDTCLGFMIKLRDVEWKSLWLLCISLINWPSTIKFWYAGHPFMCLLAICRSSSEKYLFKSLTHLKIVLFTSLLLSCISSLYNLNINPLSYVWLANVFSHYSCIFSWRISFSY